MEFCDELHQLKYVSGQSITLQAGD